jgi:hypothetical protein
MTGFTALICLIVLFYFLPTVIYVMWGRSSYEREMDMFVANLAFGFTGIGWLALMIVAIFYPDEA